MCAYRHQARLGVEGLTPHITGSKKQSDEGAVLFAVRVHVIVIFQFATKLSSSSLKIFLELNDVLFAIITDAKPISGYMRISQ